MTSFVRSRHRCPMSCAMHQFSPANGAASGLYCTLGVAQPGAYPGYPPQATSVAAALRLAHVSDSAHVIGAARAPCWHPVYQAHASPLTGSGVTTIEFPSSVAKKRPRFDYARLAESATNDYDDDAHTAHAYGDWSAERAFAAFQATQSELRFPPISAIAGQLVVVDKNRNRRTRYV